MRGNIQNRRIIFGLKVRQYRQKQGLSFADFAARTGLSVSYLNEIEKGKKSPKEDKIPLLAKALEIEPAELTSTDLPRSLLPLEELIQSNFLNELPLDFFGIELGKVVEIIAGAPSQVGAFIATLVELSRNYALAEENFYFGALRSYLEINNNYFEDIEQAVQKFKGQFELRSDTGTIPVGILKRILEKKYGYKIESGGLNEYPDLQKFRAVFVPKQKRLLLNQDLTEGQKAFQFGKELGFNYLKLKVRALTSSLQRAKSFEETLNHFKAGYFSAALLMDRATFVEDLSAFFDQNKWNGEELMHLIRKYNASPEMFFQRMTNLLPQYMGIPNLFFLRLVHHPNTGALKMDKELHLNRRHRPQGNSLQEHYCRRWISYALLKEINLLQEAGRFVSYMVGTQRSRFFGTEDEYFCITVARPTYPAPEYNTSVTLGILMEPDLKDKIRFVDDSAISTRMVNTTCERCPIEDCAERIVPPRIIQRREEHRKIAAILKSLNDGQE